MGWEWGAGGGGGEDLMTKIGQDSFWGFDNVLLLLTNDYTGVFTLWKFTEGYTYGNFLYYFNHIYIFSKTREDGEDNFSLRKWNILPQKH